MKRKSKRELVLDIYDNEAMGEVTAREIAVINQALIEEYGEGGAMTPAEIARILHDEDLPVRFDQIFRMMTTTEKYENAFARFLENDDLEQAEKSIGGIDELYRKFKQTGDRAGVRFAFEAARTARQNAVELSQLPHLPAARRREYAEIAEWFAVWLQTPDLFTNWVSLRKASAEFKKLFHQDSHRDTETQREEDGR
jgi:phosphoribulokinase